MTAFICTSKTLQTLKQPTVAMVTVGESDFCYLIFTNLYLWLQKPQLSMFLENISELMENEH